MEPSGSGPTSRISNQNRAGRSCEEVSHGLRDRPPPEGRHPVHGDAQFIAVLAAEIDFIVAAVEGEPDRSFGRAAVDVVNEQRLDLLTADNAALSAMSHKPLLRRLGSSELDKVRDDISEQHRQRASEHPEQPADRSQVLGPLRHDPQRQRHPHRGQKDHDAYAPPEPWVSPASVETSS